MLLLFLKKLVLFQIVGMHTLLKLFPKMGSCITFGEKKFGWEQGETSSICCFYGKYL